MKKLFTIAVFIGLIWSPTLAISQYQEATNPYEKNPDTLEVSQLLAPLLIHDPLFDAHAFTDAIVLLEQVNSKFHGSPINDTLKTALRSYSYLQRKELKHYQHQATFSMTLRDKKYDCLTSTLLIALVFEQLEITYQVIEFDYHVALLLEINGHSHMIDATDPLSGFLSNNDEIGKRIEFYSLADTKKQQAVVSHLQGPKIISFQELMGLYFFNRAVYHFNLQEFNPAMSMIEVAFELYPSERNEQMLRLIERQGQLVANY